MIFTKAISEYISHMPIFLFINKQIQKEATLISEGYSEILAHFNMLGGKQG